MYPSALRNLAASYRGGLLDHDEYRRQRRQWLQDLQSGKVTLNRGKAVRENQASMPAPSSTAAPDPDSDPEPEPISKPAWRTLIPLLSLVLLLSAGLLGWRMLSLDVLLPEPVVLMETPLDPLETLSRDFLGQRDWHSESVRKLILNWSSQASTQAAATPGNWQRRLQDAAEQQRARALVDLADPEANERQQALDQLLNLLTTKSR